jgi:hypothetical protein
MVIFPVDPESVPGATSISDKAIVGYVNDLAARVAALETPATPTPVTVVSIDAAAEAVINALPVGSQFTLAGPTLDFPCQKNA